MLEKEAGASSDGTAINGEGGNSSGFDTSSVDNLLSGQQSTEESTYDSLQPQAKVEESTYDTLQPAQKEALENDYDFPRLIQFYSLLIMLSRAAIVRGSINP